MALSRDRILFLGTTPHPHEEEAIRFIIDALPDNEPYSLWALCQMSDSSGRWYELDALILGYHALYLVEVKSHPGTVTGDLVDWTFRFPEGREIVRENPLRVTEHKARVLKSLLQREMRCEPPWVEAMVLLSDPNVQVRLSGQAGAKVVTRANFARAITHGELPQVPAARTRRPVDKPTARAVRDALKALGLRASETKVRIGDLELASPLLEEGPGYQDRLAEHPHMKGLERRVRCYVVPSSGSAERRAQLRRAAEREASVLLAVGDHPHILSCHDYRESGPLGGPCVVLDHLPNALPLDVLLRKRPDLPFEARVEIVRQVGEALAYCHRKGIIHRNLHPGCVLVQLDAKDRPDTRLYGFQLADDPSGGLGTSQMTAFTTQQAELYRAPEVFERPNVTKPASDIFSLGALAWHVFTGRSPGTTLAEREALLQNRHLSLAAASDGLAAQPLEDEVASLEQVVASATDVNPVTRADDAQAWIELLLEAATRPEEPTTVDPLEAKKDDRLDGDIVVEGVLGMGATARVLLVRRGGRLLALKVPLSPEQEERLRAEHETLALLRSERIVRTEGLQVLRDRTCLLTTYGGRTLADLLREDGPPSLDYARRWGEDLLSALQDLEDAGIQHRDVKPANLGVMPGASKKARHLTLLDFSLTTASVSAVTVGTPVYRDPFLLARGRWDHAADRWAAAVTLHELLTGVRPRWGDGDIPATAAEGPALIEAERFDPAVRDRLAAFFNKALARDVANRHQSAEEMRVEWLACFAAKPAAVEEPEAEEPSPEQIAALRLDTPVEALPLSPAARSALDRAGVVTVRDLLDMPANQLSVLRGVGRDTAREILAFRDVWRETHREAVAPEAVWHVTTVHFDNVEVDRVPGLPRAAAIALVDAGLSRVADVAAAPRSRVDRLLATHEGAAEALRRHFDTPETTLAGEAPATVEGWLDQLLVSPARKGRETWRTHVRILLGVEHLDGRRVTDARELARALEVTPQLIYISLGKAREAWKQHSSIAKLHEAVVATLDALGGIAPLSQVAEAVLAHIPHRGGDDPTAAAAMVRIAAETTPVIHLGRVNDVHWLGRSEAHLLAARRLGQRADELAARTPLPSSDETREALAGAARNTPLDGFPTERLVNVAAEASRTARPSARLELYQRGLPAVRAIKLVAAALPAEVTRDALVELVRRRYPDAESLPEHRDLDPLMAEVGLDWDETRRSYRRHGAFPTTSSATDQIRTIVAPRPGARALATEDEEERSEFETRIRLALEQRALRVLEVNANYADRLVERLRNRFQLTPRSIEADLLAALQRRMTEDGVEADVVFDADRRGPGGEDWRPLAALAAAASDDVLRDLRSAREPILLTRPGLLARYDLGEFLKGVLDAAQTDDFPALFLVVPSVEGQGAAPIDGGPDVAPLPVPVTVPSQRLRVPRAWLEAPQ